MRIDVFHHRPKRRFGIWFEEDPSETVGMEPPEWSDDRNVFAPKPVEDRRFLDSVPGLLRVTVSVFKPSGVPG